jgi:hypothetical protein
MKLTSTAAALVASVVGAPLALAEPGGADHDFVTLDRLNGQSQAGIALSKVFAEDLGIYRFDLYGQYVTPTGLGGAVSMPFTYVTFNGESESGIGNLALAGFYVQRGRQADIVFSGGVFLPTASDDDAILNVVSAGGARLTDYASGGDATWLRLAVSPAVHSGEIFARADLGADIPLGADFDLDALARINVAVGLEVAQGQGEITLELNNLIAIGTDDDDSSLQAFGFAGRYTAGTIHPFAAMIIPYLESADGLDFTLTLGVAGDFGGASASP